jgi:hypothetical protein
LNPAALPPAALSRTVMAVFLAARIAGEAGVSAACGGGGRPRHARQRRGRGRGAKRGGQTWPMGSAATCFEPPVPSFLSGLDGALRAGAYRVCAGPAEMLARIDEPGVRASQG